MKLIQSRTSKSSFCLNIPGNKEYTNRNLIGWIASAKRPFHSDKIQTNTNGNSIMIEKPPMTNLKYIFHNHSDLLLARVMNRNDASFLSKFKSNNRIHVNFFFVFVKRRNCSTENSIRNRKFFEHTTLYWLLGIPFAKPMVAIFIKCAI